jgi:phage N-6-adenine-methyltransferase
MAPTQKPGKSNQVVSTPPEFLAAVRQRLGIREFAIDLAASHENAVCEPYFTRETDSLSQPWHQFCGNGKGWGWLNPEFADIAPWASKAFAESRLGAQLAMLVPSATDTEWWHDHVRGHGYATHLRQRIRFIGHTDQYPKGLALVLYAPFLEGGECWWSWKPSTRRVTC